MYPPFGTSWTLKTNEWLQFVVKRLQIHASSIHFCLKIKWFHKIFHQTSTHHTLESPEAGGRPRSTTSCIPGLTERFTAHLRGFFQPKVENAEKSWGFFGIWMFPKNRGTPKSSILTGFSIINHPFWVTPIFGNIHIIYWKLRYIRQRGGGEARCGQQRPAKRGMKKTPKAMRTEGFLWPKYICVIN